MPKPHPTTLIVGTGLLTAETIASDLRARLTRELGQLYRFLPTQTLVEHARRILSQYEPILAENIAFVDLAGWVAGFDEVAKQLPPHVLATYTRLLGGPPVPPADVVSGIFGGDGEPIVRFPMIEKAAESLLRRSILTPEQFAAADELARGNAVRAAGDLAESTVETIREVLSEVVDRGASLDRFERELKSRLDTSALGPGRAENIYRTNVQTAFHDGHDELASDPIVAAVFPYQEYLAVHDARARPTHRALETLGIDGTGVYRKEDPFWAYFTPAWDYNCLLPGTEIQGRIELLLRSWYAGEVVEIVTSSAKRLRVTVNHPILTPEGFVEAGTVRRGDNVLRYRGVNHGRSDANIAAASDRHPRRSSPDVHKQHRPSTIANLFATLALKNELGRFPVGSDDLHGEAAKTQGYVDVVGADRKLSINPKAGGLKSSDQFTFAISDPSPAAAMTTLGNGFLGRFGERAALRGIPSGSALPFNGGGVSLDVRPLHALRIGLAANLDASRYELPAECPAVASGLAGQFLHRFPGQVFVDEVREVRRYNFCGHVYDAQASGGWLVGDGVIISNCRCGVNLLTIDAAARRGVQEASEWLRTGRKPPLQSRLPFIPFRPPVSFGQRGRVAA